MSATTENPTLAELAVELDAIASFADAVYGGNCTDSFLWDKLQAVVFRLEIAHFGSVEAVDSAGGFSPASAYARRHELLA